MVNAVQDVLIRFGPKRRETVYGTLGAMYGHLQDIQTSDYSKRAEIGMLGYLGPLHCFF